ncbi:ATP-binding protein [Actinomadura madurae]|uniref:ATP-binding protein n=1 Tax=Actinomadura madurae TaxID=1993 RepID=UPI0020D1FC8D|nr:AAA family ATPase [Actinomadura madurae]
MAGVHLSILRREPAGAAAPAASAAPERAPGGRRAARTNLPAQLTSFVGREEESKRVGKLLRETRLVTLTGPGGAGKTRLAGESAAALVDEMPDGVWFVPLAPVTDPGDVVQALLSALGVPETVRPAETRAVVRPLERLTDFLATKRMVVVLDNCEHLVDAVARLADHLAAQADGLRILATSREPLGITGEALCPVPSLPLPDEHVTDPADALGHASVRLFADRAAAVRPGFAVDGSTVADVVAICRALDGIPLAIELAAARLRSLTSGQVAARLGDRFRLLSGGSRTALPRHRTLRAVVDWSWDLLDDVERAVLRRLSVFAGGATPDAAVHVCGLDAPDAPDPPDVIDVIAALIDKSLVMADGDTDVRYRLLETVRVYAGERLEQAGETRRVRDAHVAHLVGLAERAEPELRRGDQLRWAARLAAERENFTTAFRHVTETRDVESGLRLVAGLVWFWVVRDMEREAGGWTFAVRDMAGDAAPPGLEEEYALCVVAANVLGEMTTEPGPTAGSMHRTLEDAAARMPEAPMHPMLALARPALSIFSGDMADIRSRMGGIKEHPDPWVRAVARVVLAHVGINLGDLSEAVEGAADGYARFRELGDRFGDDRRAERDDPSRHGPRRDAGGGPARRRGLRVRDGRGQPGAGLRHPRPAGQGPRPARRHRPRPRRTRTRRGADGTDRRVRGRRELLAPAVRAGPSGGRPRRRPHPRRPRLQVGGIARAPCRLRAGVPPYLQPPRLPRRGGRRPGGGAAVAPPCPGRPGERPAHGQSERGVPHRGPRRVRRRERRARPRRRAARHRARPARVSGHDEPRGPAHPAGRLRSPRGGRLRRGVRARPPDHPQRGLRAGRRSGRVRVRRLRGGRFAACMS